MKDSNKRASHINVSFIVAVAVTCYEKRLQYRMDSEVRPFTERSKEKT